MTKHVLGPADLTRDERAAILDRAAALKAGEKGPGWSGLRVGGLFFNPSLRTRVSWEQAASILGGRAQTLNAGADLWKMEMDPQAIMDADSVECVVEAAGVLGRYFHVLGIRSFPQGRPWEEEKEEPILRAFCRHSGCSIVSLEGAMHHPCQGLADHLTLREQLGQTKGAEVALMWAWHPKALPMAVPNTFALEAAFSGANLRIVHPEGWELDAGLMSQVEKAAAEAGGSVRVEQDRLKGLDGAQAVYVKSWSRLSTPGVPAPETMRKWIFDEGAHAATADAKVMHCLPTRRNVEIASSILDSPRSVVLDEAENRLWVQTALIEHLAGGKRGLA